MVNLKVIRNEELPGYGAVWRGRKGTKFALRIGKRRQDLLTKFIASNALLPVTASVLLLDRVRPDAAYPITLGKHRHVGFVLGQFFILIRFHELKDDIRNSVGERKDFTQDELVNAVVS